LASCHMLRDFPDLDETMRRQLYRRCVSSAWKARRQLEGADRALLSREFLRYACSQWSLRPVNDKALEEMSRFLAHVKGVRRTHVH
ncbi:MAG: hypothetical protein KGJ06_06710, partial [Pseudomonadota bacterium]|nr:hypothetical protein [Pseudomonadota bacterium]